MAEARALSTDTAAWNLPMVDMAGAVRGSRIDVMGDNISYRTLLCGADAVPLC